jgi:hypothetical protein
MCPTNKQHQTYIDHNRMELCYLETKWTILGNKTSNLNRWTIDWNISRDYNGIQRQVS